MPLTLNSVYFYHTIPIILPVEEGQLGNIKLQKAHHLADLFLSVTVLVELTFAILRSKYTGR